MGNKDNAETPKSGRFGRRKHQPAEYEPGEFFVLPPEMEDDEAILHVDKPAEEPTSPEMPQGENVVSLEELSARRQAETAEEPVGDTVVVDADLDKTRIAEDVSGDTVVVSDNAPAPAPAPTDEVEGQMKLEDWEEPPALGDDWQERLRRTRQEQMEDFERRREKAGGLKLSGEEEVNDPAEEPPAPTVEEPEEELEDYSRYEETAAVRGELLYRRRMGWITLLASAVPELLLLWLALVAYLFSGVSVLHILVSLILLGVMVAVNYRTVLNGWKNLFHMAADADTPAAVA